MTGHIYWALTMYQAIWKALRHYPLCLYNTGRFWDLPIHGGECWSRGLPDLSNGKYSLPLLKLSLACLMLLLWNRSYFPMHFGQRPNPSAPRCVPWRPDHLIQMVLLRQIQQARIRTTRTVFETKPRRGLGLWPRRWILVLVGAVKPLSSEGCPCATASQQMWDHCHTQLAHCPGTWWVTSKIYQINGWLNELPPLWDVIQDICNCKPWLSCSVG